MKNKKKAFTLTELLVVVIVIGVLSAAVLPKFSKVIETRKTTEAEELMASIRTEQEKRCALDKQYITDDISRLTDVVTNPDTKNYQLTLQGTGVIASSKGKYSYTLEMPSYLDGRICCRGNDCEKLNKNYPNCDGGFTYEPSPENCAGTVPDPTEPTPCEIDPTSCECNPNQAKCCAAGEVWQDGKCVPEPKECTDPKPDSSQACNKCGTQTRSVTCDTTTGEWVIEGDWGDCSVENESECEASTCREKNAAGELGAYCAEHRLFPKWTFGLNTALSPSNCCQSCEEAGGIMNNGECVYGGWYAAVTEEVIGIRYGKSYPTVTLRKGEDSWGWGGSWALQELAQYGPRPGYSCDFSGYDKIYSNGLTNFDQSAFEARCASCKLNNTCSYTDYKLKTGWVLIYDSSQVQSEAVCCLYANDYRGSTLGEIASCMASTEGISLDGDHCENEMGGLGDLCYPNCGKDYTGLGLSLTTSQISDMKKRCAEARAANKNRKCYPVGIPSDAYAPSNESYDNLTEVAGSTMASESDCKVVLSSGGVDVYGAVVEKWGCVQDPNAGQPVF